MAHIGVELLFFFYCTDKVFRKLNVPLTPEPLINREWSDVARHVWASQDDTASRRDYVMGWFYDAPFDRLRSEDALSYLAWARYGLPLESGLLSDEEINSLCDFDLPLLLDNVNGGMSLPNRHLEEEPLPFMRFNCEPLRYRHKSLLFYTVTHGANFMLQKQLKKKGYVYVPAQNSEKDLSYWYRLPSKGKVNEEQLNEVNPLVFIHGVGGLGFCNTLIEEIGVATQDDNVPIVLIDLPHVSLRFYDEIPLIKSQTKAISKILDDVTSNAGGDVSSSKATLVGHSFGTAVMSWLVQDAPEKISGCVFLGKICLLPFINCIVPLFLISSIPSSTRSNLFPASPQDHPFQFSSPKGGRGVAKQQKMG
jgi:pimeloyl-ACP methyl ester carboxylesterase